MGGRVNGALVFQMEVTLSLLHSIRRLLLGLHLLLGSRPTRITSSLYVTPSSEKVMVHRFSGSKSSHEWFNASI
jgi:hypothetical protein